MTERSINTIPSQNERVEIKLPVAGDTIQEGDIKYIWTIKTDDNCSIGQWVREGNLTEETCTNPIWTMGHNI